MKPNFEGSPFEYESTSSIEYYKRKENGIESHLSDLQPSVMAALVSDASNHDDLKYFLQREFNARTYEYGTVEGYRKAIKAEQAAFLTEKENFYDTYKGDRQKLEDIWEAASEEDEEFFNEVSNNKIPGLVTATMGGVPGYGSRGYQGAKSLIEYRLNIRVDYPNTVNNIQTQLARTFSTNNILTNTDFAIKNFGNNAQRDGIILYLEGRNINEALRVVTDFCSSHEVGNNKGIMFGQEVKNRAGIRLPNVRITSEPKNHRTYNELQSDIVSGAVKRLLTRYRSTEEYLKYYFANQEQVMNEWEQNFPSYYKQSAWDVVGANNDLHNLAFIG